MRHHRTPWGRVDLDAHGTAVRLTAHPPQHPLVALARTAARPPTGPALTVVAALLALYPPLAAGNRWWFAGALVGLALAAAGAPIIECAGRQLDGPLPTHTVTDPEHLQTVLEVAALAADHLERHALRRRVWTAAWSPEAAEELLAEELDALRWAGATT